jgi:hypothetical protein
VIGAGIPDGIDFQFGMCCSNSFIIPECFMSVGKMKDFMILSTGVAVWSNIIRN